ncbi:MAG TPA: prolipoprotein diacylglyceryl transferase [Candidatus Eremiobacteraceae bacterium]|nr:prolipoprotein diacylglyceryl transferase [Candidatus Eremiobacteraceae bacterium]
MLAPLATSPHWFTYPNINPVAFHIWRLDVRWYGLSYLFGAILVYLQLQSRRSRERTGLSIDQAQELVVYAMIGVILGGRLLFLIADMLTPVSSGGHDASYYLQNPVEIVAIWHGGMAFHGGFIGAVLGIWLFVRRSKVSFYRVCDEIALWMPVAIASTRIVNFINNELPGRLTDSAIGIQFPGYAGYRYPSQIFEAIGMIAIVLPLGWILHGWSKRRDGLVFWGFIASYGLVRTIVEFYREPGIVFLGLTAAQYLTLAMLVIGAVMMWRVQQAPAEPIRKSASGRVVKGSSGSSAS